MKKPTLIALLLFVLLFSKEGLRAADVTDLTYVNNTVYVTITDCDTSASGALEIPNTIEGNSVRAIADDAFNACRNLTDIIIPNSVTSIGHRSFFACSGLASFIIPNSVTSIGNEAFVFCSSLTSITIGNGLTIINSAAFAYCEGLRSLTIPKNIQSIRNYAFADSSNLEQIYFDGNAPTLGASVFRNVFAAVFVNRTASGFDETFGGLTVAIIPNDDTDGDGVPDDDDAFPNDPSETADSDSDGVGDNADVFPNDPTEVADCDNDGVGDNADARSGEHIVQLQAQITQLQAQLSQRPTLEELVDARAGSIVLVADQENNEVTISFKVEETKNLKQGTWRTVQGGDISLKVALEPGNKFMRIALGE